MKKITGLNPDLLVVLFLAGLSVLLFWPALFGGKMLWGLDIEALGLPFQTAARRSLAQGEWPLWTPGMEGGIPGLAALSLEFLHPFELVFCLLHLPVAMGYGLDACLEVFLSGLGMFLFLRRLGLSRAAGLLGAFFYCCSGSQISLLFAGHVNNFMAIAMIPWVFWGAHKGCAQKSWLSWGFCGVALSLQVLALGMQIFAYTLLVLAPFVAWLAWSQHDRPWKASLLGLALALASATLLAAPQLWLTLQYLPYSWRHDFSYEDFISGSFIPREGLTWLVPGFFGWRAPGYYGSPETRLTSEYFGLLPWGLACGALAALWRAPGAVRMLAILAVGSFLFALGKWFPLHHLFFHLPLYSSFRTSSRFLVFLTFAVCCLAAFGWDALGSLQSPAARRGGLAFCALAFLVALISYGAVPDWAPQGGSLARLSSIKTGSLAAVLAFLFWRMREHDARGLLLLALLVGIHGFDQSEVARCFLDFRDPAPLLRQSGLLRTLPSPDAPEPWRVVDSGGVWPRNSQMIFGYEDVIGYEGLKMSAPHQLQDAMQGRQLAWLSLMNVRYVLSRDPVPGLPLLASSAEGKTYFNPHALPRAWLVGRFERVQDGAAAFARMGDPGLDFRNVAVLTADPGLPAGGGLKAPGRVDWLRRSPNAFSLEVDSPQAALLVVSNNWYPSWRAEVDGQPQPVLKADGALQAVLLPAGRHRVEFHYSAGLLDAALGAFLLGLLALFALWKLEKGRYNRESIP